MNPQIGMMAGQVWKYLHEHGETSVYQLCRQLEVQERLVYMALGWLAREGKLIWSRQGRGLYVDLATHERGE